MFAKLCCVVVAVGAFGCALLAMRQGRLQAASELTQTQLRISNLDRGLWDLRAKIAERTTPTAIEKLAVGLGPLRPMIPDDGSVEPMEAAEAGPPRKFPALGGTPRATIVQPVLARHAGR